MDVAKIDRDVAHVAYVASVSDECRKRLFKNVYLFQMYVYKRFYQNVAYVSYICCKRMFPNVSFVSDVCCSKCFMLQVFSLAGTGSEHS
jgi:hypothetical protein